MEEKEAATDETAGTAEKKGFSLISDETLLALYGNLLRCRMLNERAGSRGRSVGPPGCEAATVGVVMDLVPGDTVQSSEADVLPHFLLGQGWKGLLSKPARRPSWEDQVHRALGSALTHKTSRDGKISAIFWSEEETEHWQSALDVARAHRLPLIFISQADLNGSSINRRVPGKKAADPVGTEMPHIVVDGADAVAVYRVAHESIARARRDRGPTLIDCRNYKVQGKRSRGPNSVANMEAYLRSKGLLKRGLKRQVTESFTSELKRAGLG